MNFSPRQILTVIAILLVLVGLFAPVPLWIPVLLLGIANLLP